MLFYDQGFHYNPRLRSSFKDYVSQHLGVNYDLGHSPQGDLSGYDFCHSWSEILCFGHYSSGTFMCTGGIVRGSPCGLYVHYHYIIVQYYYYYYYYY